MTLTIRPTDPDRPAEHFQLCSGNVRIGTIYRTNKDAAGKQWFWSLNGVENGPVRLDGFAMTLAGAKAEFTLSWRAWLAAAGLTERAPTAAVEDSDFKSA